MKKSAPKQLKFSVMIPTYNMGKTIGDTIKSVLNQSYQNFEIIVQDNDSSDDTKKVIKLLADERIKYYKNPKNLGYAKNIIEGAKNCTGDIVYFLGADDILAIDALKNTNDAFVKNESIGAVTRPYYWFQERVDTPIRVTPILNNKKDEVVKIDEFDKAIYVLHNEILGQMTSLAFRRKFLRMNFFTDSNDWIAHGYPFLHVFKEHPVVFLKNCPVAIRIGGNTIRQKGTKAYAVSPTKRWIEMLEELLPEKKFFKIRNYFIKQVIAKNYLGLIQIKCYSSQKNLLREIFYLVKYNRLNVFDIKFWFFSLGCLLIPDFILAPMVDFYKNRINSKIITDVNFTYSIS